VCLLRGTDWIFIYNSTFCPHSVFMRFVRISEQRTIIFLYNIKSLFVVKENQCVYSDVPNELYNIVGEWLRRSVHVIATSIQQLNKGQYMNRASSRAGTVCVSRNSHLRHS